MPKLQINLPDSPQLDHELTGDVITIGRATDNTLPIDNASVSGHHAKIEPIGDGGYMLVDMGSTNGTRLNGVDLKPEESHKLDPGDRIRFGHVEAVFDPENAKAEDAQELPGDDHVAAVAKSSVKPSNFMNASPFQKRTTKKDTVGMALMGLAAVVLLAALVVLAMTFALKTSS
jgi:pSer/pThr/pTyr-binding forkhead associated (FHA) protein